ncbi:nucleotidyl transferase AbiEii/AbiGii toxin family protein [Patescibacteria group bacterium]|nr:nucleotidyl transferase AbiEii/AbiGii toxin family protein [Patescibacteria group bacterium]
MGKSMLNDFQKEVLAIFCKTVLAKKFYLAGGTALSEFYFHHRKSEDLDFFTEEELDIRELERFVNLIGKKISLEKVEYQHGFGLYTYFFYPKSETIKHKIDFGQYPFPLIEKPKRLAGLQIEALYDIAVDKTHTISVRPRLRDFVDLYFIFQEKKEWNLKDLLQKAFEKFGIKVDPLQLGESLFQVKNLEDMPIMLKKFDRQTMENFFLTEARKLEKKIWLKP